MHRAALFKQFHQSLLKQNHIKIAWNFAIVRPVF